MIDNIIATINEKSAKEKAHSERGFRILSAVNDMFPHLRSKTPIQTYLKISCQRV